MEDPEVEGMADGATSTEDEADACGRFRVADRVSLRITNLPPVRERVLERTVRQ
jgi:hypothetical protein